MVAAETGPLPRARRTRGRPAMALAGVVTSLALVGAMLVDRPPKQLPLYSGTVALASDGVAVAVPDDPALLLPGTRVLRSAPGAPELAARQDAWVRSGSVPVVPELNDSAMVRDALLDLHTLSVEHGVPVAGWSGPWHYVWPRDSALAAAAFARTGHIGEADAIIGFLQRVQPASGRFQARYLADGSGVPDDRGVQLDGVGWSLWAMSQVAEQLPPSDRARFIRRHRSLLDRSSSAIVAMLDPVTGLPPPSPDYWELPETRTTLATAALLHAGLDAASGLYLAVNAASRARTMAMERSRLAAAIERGFGRHGFPRSIGGDADTVDLGVCFLLPPFSDAGATDAATVTAWQEAADRMRRQAGGLAPGASWPDDGVSWNTATATYAMTAAFLGDRATAVAWLHWLDDHRTLHGSLPEKVLHDGRPASVAPLAWAAAAVVLAASALDHTSGMAPVDAGTT